MLEVLIPSETRVKLLTLFLLNPGKEYYIRQVERLTDTNYRLVRRELSRLESFGLLKSDIKGKQIFYTVDQDFYLFPELQKIILKTEGVSRILKDNLTRLGDLVYVFIYGSFASGKAGPKSDIDLFIVGDVDETQLIQLINTCEKEIQKEINYTLLKKEELDERMRKTDPFIRNVLNRPRIMIIGEDCYGKTAGDGRED